MSGVRVLHSLPWAERDGRERDGHERDGHGHDGRERDGHERTRLFPYPQFAALPLS